MNKRELLVLVNKFGLIITEGCFPKINYPGWINEIDDTGNIWFKGTDEEVFVFNPSSIKCFEVKEFNSK